MIVNLGAMAARFLYTVGFRVPCKTCGQWNGPPGGCLHCDDSLTGSVAPWHATACVRTVAPGVAGGVVRHWDWMWSMLDSRAPRGSSGGEGSVRFSLGLVSLAALVLTACAQPSATLPGGLDLRYPYTQVEPTGRAVSDLTVAASRYQAHSEQTIATELEGLSLSGCLELALDHNRALRRATHAAERIGLGQDIARRDLDNPFFDATYTAVAGDDTGGGTASATGRFAGFEVEPFISYAHDEGADDELTGSYGVAVSRQLFRLDTERIRQYLPLTGATRDFHIALNDRVLELRRLRLEVVEAFYNIQRLNLRVAVRVNRQADAEQFLEQVRVLLEQGFASPAEETNAKISLNQAQADLIREQTNLQNAKEALLDLLGLELTRSLSIREEDLTAIRHASINLPADTALVTAHHESVRNLLLVMEVRRLEYRVDLAELQPDLSATVVASRDTDGLGDDGELAATFNLSIPLDGYRAERARATQDRLRLMESTLELAALRSVLERELRRRQRAIDQLKITVRLAEERLESERNKLKSEIKNYDLGRSDNLELVRAKATVDTAELALLDARIDRILEEARYRALLPAPPVVPTEARPADDHGDGADAQDRRATDEDSKP